MSAVEHTDLASTDLPITLYLNQRMTFDVLAVLRGGFSSFSTVQTSSSEEISKDRNRMAGLGVSNVFALLGVSISSQSSRNEGKAEHQNTTEEIIHTPASLFAQLRRDLQIRGLVKEVTSASDINEIRPSDFVEFEATLRRSPVIELLDAFSTLMPSIGQIEPTVNHQGNRKGSGQRKAGRRTSSREQEYTTLNRQIDAIRSLVTSEGSQDFIAEMPNQRFVLTTEQDYFVDPSMNDIIDGTFRVFGKATRVIETPAESISLFRRTAAAKFGVLEKELGSAFDSLKTPEVSDSLVTEINGPTMQVAPIAIFS